MELKDNKFTQSIIGCSKEKLRSFSLFLKSPFYNSNNNLLLLFEEIRRFGPRFENKNYNLKHLYKKVYGATEKFSSSRINKHFYDLNKYWLKFLAADELLRSQDNWVPFTINSLQSQLKKSEAEVLIINQIKDLAKNPYRDAKDYLTLSNYYKQLFEFSIEKNNHGDLSLQQQYKYCLDKYYHLETLSNLLSVYSRNSIVNKKIKIRVDSRLRKFVSNIDKVDEPVFSLYLLLIDFYQERNIDNYHVIKNKYFNSIEKLSLDQRKIIHTNLANFIFYWIKSGDGSFVNEQFLLYKFGLTNNIYGDKYISTQTFINVVVSCCLAKEMEYATSFVEIYKERLDKEGKSDSFLISKAFIAFYQSNFDEAHRLLSQIESNEMHFQLRARTLNLRCIYEFTRRDASFEKVLASKTIAFERFLTREVTLSPEFVEAYMNFVRTLKSLTSKTARNNTNEFRQRSIEKLGAYKNIIAKTWFEEKIMELEPKG